MADRFTVSFTGTRDGMTLLQQQTVGRMLSRLRTRHGVDLYGVHGDCIGADDHFDGLCLALGIPRGIYPSNLAKTRAHCELRGAEALADPAPPLDRNVLVVRVGDLLIATPKQYVETQRSGTWHAVRCARREYKERREGSIVIVWPNGEGEFDFPEKRPVRLDTSDERAR